MHQVLGSSVGRAGSARRGLLALAGVLVLMLAWASAAHADSFTVTNTDDTGDGSLRSAITDAAGTAGADTITISATGTLTLATALPALPDGVTITGPGASKFTIDGGGQFQPFFVGAGSTVSISGLTVTNGDAGQSRGGGIQDVGSLTLTGVTVSNSTSLTYGGGIEVASGGTLTATQITVSGNKAVASNNGNGGGIDVAGGGTLNLFDSTVSNNISGGNAGGLRVEGTATAERDTFSGNMATGGFAGAIGVTSGSEEFAATGRLTLKNSTVTGNSASLNAGGLGGFGNVTVVASTIASNTAPTGSNLVAEGGGTTTLQNTIVADPMVAPTHVVALAASGGTNCASMGGTLASNGFNLEDDAGDTTTSTPPSCNFTQSTDLTGVDPKLAPLADNGGLTQTRALMPGSPAIDTGTAEGLTTNRAGRVSDQRGVIRPVGVQADIGAFELAPPTAVTGAASDVTPTGATVAGTATNPDVTGGQAFFEYGPANDPTGTKTSSQPVAAGASGAAISAPLTGLTPSTTYHYRLIVTNADGVSTGEDKTFTTPAPPDTTKPTVTIVTPADGASYRQGDTVRANYNCMDEPGGSGLKSCVGTVPNGSPIDTSPSRTAASVTFPVSSRSFTVTATDNAGNTASKTVHYRVVGAAVQGPVAELGLSLRARPGRVHVGSRLAYTLTVTNHGPDRATGVVVRERLPGQVSFVSVRTSRGGSCTGRRIVVCRFSSLSATSSVRVVITVRAVHLGRARSTARVAGAQTDPVPGNNTSSATISVVPQPHPRFAG